MPRLKTAVTDINTAQGMADWCEPFVTELAAACMPGHTIEIRKIYDPQDREESKEPAKFEDVINSYTRQFADFVADLEIQSKSQISKL